MRSVQLGKIPRLNSRAMGKDIHNFEYKDCVLGKGTRRPSPPAPEEHIQVPPGAYAQNARVKRVILTILNGVRTLLSQTGLPSTFRAEPASYIVYCMNRSPNSRGHISEEHW